MRIMVADDAGFIREIIAGVCLESGHDVVAEAANGTEAVALALVTKPDLLILDMVLPEMNGVEVITEILANEPGLMIAAMSSMDSSSIEDKAKKAGAFYFMKKPFTREDLLGVINQVGIQQKERKLKYG